MDEAVQSLLAQSLVPDEIIIIDDGSTEPETLAVLEKSSWPKTRVIRQDNAGVSAARNAGISDSKGDYIVNLDSDDRFDPTFLEKASQILDSDEKVGAVGSWVEVFGSRTGTWKPVGGTTADFLSENQCTSNNLFRRTFWEKTGGFDETMKKGFEDWEFWLHGTSLGWSVSIIPEVLTFYRKKDVKSGMAVAYENKPEIVAYIAKKHLALYQEHVVRVLKEKEELVQRVYNSPVYTAGLEVLGKNHPLS